MFLLSYFQAAQLIEEEVSILRVGMGHEDASVDDFSEAHDACLEDMMYFPGRNSYGLGSVASVTDKLAATQNDFENVRNHMESETRKAVRLEQKLKVLTQGYNVCKVFFANFKYHFSLAIMECYG